jgi:predicted secreted protein
MARLGASLALCAALAGPALAGDRALIDYLGYSADGRYFAFEEYGIQDGSGFAYAKLYVIDLPADKWVAGTPFTARIETEPASVDVARSAVFDDAAELLAQLEIGRGALPLAVNADGEPDAAAHGLSFGTPGYGLGGVQDEHLLELETVALPPGIDCAIIDNKTFGFALRLDGVELHRDSGKLPASRGCAMDYRLYAVVGPPDWLYGAAAPRIAIVASYPFGFEGPDRRFLAVPLPE